MYAAFTDVHTCTCTKININVRLCANICETNQKEILQKEKMINALNIVISC